jgi:hypothetical protein
MDTKTHVLDADQPTNGLKELAYWGALIVANVACLGLMVMLLFR